MNYNDLFDQEAKAKAFDQLAERYYMKNFGTIQKSDLDTLMFSIFMERVLDEKTDSDLMVFDDYEMSKVLGVTQSRISTLKEKKQLQYPHEYNWKKSFLRLVDRARYEGNRIKIQIPDKNLYIEIQHAIEENGGYIDAKCAKNTLSVSPYDFIDLLLLAKNDVERKKAIEEIKKITQNHKNAQDSDQKILDAQPFGKQLSGLGKGILIDAVKSVLGDTVADLLKKHVGL